MSQDPREAVILNALYAGGRAEPAETALSEIIDERDQLRELATKLFIDPTPLSPDQLDCLRDLLGLPAGPKKS